jgi:hypothetical protein
MISSTIRKVGPFIGAGLVSTFPFPFKVFAATDLKAVQADSGGFETALILNSSFTAALNADQDNNPGGSITLSSPLGVGFTLIITTSMSETQTVQISDLGGFYPAVLNALHDRTTILVQQLQEQIDRCIKFPTTDPSGSQLGSPEARANTLLGFGSDGGINTTKTILPVGTTLFSGTLTGTKDGSNKVFTLTNGGSAIGVTPLWAIVWDNFPLINGIGFSLGPSAGQVTFATAPLSTDTLYAQGVY